MRRTPRLLSGLAVTLLFLSACSSVPGDAVEDRFLIQHHKVGCEGEGIQTCMLTRRSEQDSWSNFYGGIEGFEYEWGYQYELRVQVTEVIDPPADASSRAYSMIEMVSKVEVDADSSFKFSLMPAEGFAERVSATEFQLGYEVNFNCDVSTCDTVSSLLTQEMAMVLQFQHADDATGRLRLQGILCSDTSPQFYESCRSDSARQMLIAEQVVSAG